MISKELSGLLVLLILFISCTNKVEENISSEDLVLFKKLESSSTNIQFENKITETNKRNHLINFYYYDGGGVAAGDINNDGLPDLYFVGNMVPDKLYLNKGNLVFEDISEAAGIYKKGVDIWGTGVTMADVNGDSYLDIYVCKSDEIKGGRNLLFINNQDLTFTESGKAYGLDDIGFASNASFFDYDRDGDLDMYLVNTPPPLYAELEFQEEAKRNTPVLYADKLYKNDRNKFVDVTRQAGMRYLYAFGLSGTIGDLNNDGWPDIFVGNDFEAPDLMYLNQGNGKFKEVCKKVTKHISNNSMGCDIADFNNDGHLDIFTLDMMAEDHYRQKINAFTMNRSMFRNFIAYGYHYQYMQNVLNMNNGNATFSDVAQIGGICYTDWSWSCLFADFDNDGWKDLFITNGILKETGNMDYRREKEKLLANNAGLTYMEMIDLIPSVKVSNYLYHNKGNYSFSNMAQAWGLDQAGFSNGAAYTDLDADGDLDIVVNNCNEKAWVYENRLQQLKNSNFLQIKLKGYRKNSFGLGTRVELYTDGKKQVQELTLTRGYYSSVEPLIHFGLGENKKIDSLIVRWPDGKIEKLEKLSSNQQLLIKHTNVSRTKAKNKVGNKQLFEDITKKLDLNYKHEENVYNDFENEKHLPHKMSQFGPPLAIGDIDGDNDEDFFIGGASGFTGAVFFQQENGTFKESEDVSFLLADKKCEDTGACLFDADGDGDLDLYVASGGNEFKLNDLSFRDRIYLNDGSGNFNKAKQNLPNLRYSSSCVKPFDYDNDGDLDLFVGGRLVPGKYPLPATSCLLENTNGVFQDVTASKAEHLIRVGMVTDAVWADINTDNQTDLILVGEWMPVTVLLNKAGKFTDNTSEMGLDSDIGWWYSIDEADFDKDGDKDLVVGNLGLNYKYKASKEEPFYVFSDDFDNNNSLDIVLAYHNFGKLVPIRGRECAIDQMPVLDKNFPNYHSYSKASVYDLYGSEKLKNSLNYKTTNFASSYLENQEGKSFTIKKLPVEAQFSSINDFIIEDFNKDGNLDLILSGNLYPVSFETVRNDAGIGLLLLGDGQGNFNPRPYYETGYLTNQDVKNLGRIQTVIGPVILSASNNDFLKAQLLK